MRHGAQKGPHRAHHEGDQHRPGCGSRRQRPGTHRDGNRLLRPHARAAGAPWQAGCRGASERRHLGRRASQRRGHGTVPGQGGALGAWRQEGDTALRLRPALHGRGPLRGVHGLQRTQRPRLRRALLPRIRRQLPDRDDTSLLQVVLQRGQVLTLHLILGWKRASSGGGGVQGVRQGLEDGGQENPGKRRGRVDQVRTGWCSPGWAMRMRR